MNPLWKLLVKKLINVLYTDGIYPLADAYVKSTTNTWDDKALLFLDEFINDLLSKL